MKFAVTYGKHQAAPPQPGAGQKPNHKGLPIPMRSEYDRNNCQGEGELCLEEEELHWFSFKPRKRLVPDNRGVFRSHVFPGLWLDGPALLARDSRRLLQTLDQGLATLEHAAFVRWLGGRRV
jgi:hypothetical protein